MNKMNTSGGGQSSLGYLFGSADEQKGDPTKVPSSPTVCMPPPYGTDYMEEKSPPEKTPTSVEEYVCMPPPYGTDYMEEKSPPEKTPTSVEEYIYRGDGDKSKSFLVTGRPSTKVKSVPGGDSSLGYLFGDK